MNSRRRVNSTVRRFPIYSPATSSKGANMKKVFHLCAMLLALVPPALLTAVSSQVGVAQNADLRARIQQAPKLPLEAVALKALPLHDGWQLGMVSWIAVDRTGLIYLLQRGDKADPIVVIDHEGHVVRSWGKGCTRCRTRSASTPKAMCGQPTQL